MKILLATLGTRGDVQPFLALGEVLLGRGHDVTIALNADLESFAQRAGVPCQPLAFDVAELYRRPRTRRLLARSDLRGLLAYSQGWLAEVQPALCAGLEHASRGADVVVSGFVLDDFAAAAAEARGAAFVLSGFAPYLPGTGHPSIVMTQRSLPLEILHRATHALTERLAYGPKAQLVDDFRRRLGLPASRGSIMRRTALEKLPYIGAWSRSLFAAPSSYGPEQQVTGYWFGSPALRARLAPQADQDCAHQDGTQQPLQAWLARGEKPVLVSFGSMPLMEPRRVFALCEALAERLATRVLLAGATSEVRELVATETVHVLRRPIDHHWLLPRCAAVVHHGGAGITHTSTALGLPSWAVSLFADGPFWGSRLRARRIGGHTPYAEFGEHTLTAAVQTLLDASTRERARAVAEELTVESGALAAAMCVERSVLGRTRAKEHGHAAQEDA